MNKLTAKEEEVMRYFWDNDALFVKELVEMYPDPKPHINTLSTYVRALEEKGLLSHDTFGTTYRYFAIVSEDEYSDRTLKNVVKKYANHDDNADAYFSKTKNKSKIELPIGGK